MPYHYVCGGGDHLHAAEHSGQRRPKKRILIVDDHAIVRELFTQLVNTVPDLEVCGEAEDVAPALEMLARTSPDLALVDMTLKSSNGLDLIKLAKIYYPRVA